MQTVIVKRYKNCPDGIFGEIGNKYYTLENPLKAIPAGTYDCLWLNHPKHGWCYEVQNVPGRTAILIHKANFWDELEGCIALGLSVGKIDNRLGIGSSKIAVTAFNAEMKQEPFLLQIDDVVS